MSRSLLVTRPNHDSTTNYLCAWCDEVIALAVQKSIPVYDLLGAKATRKNLESYLQANSPSILFLNGHGSESVIYGHLDSVVIDGNTPIPSKILYARSCNCGKKLGLEIANNGTIFIGYKRRYYVACLKIYATRPKQDPLAVYFLKPSNLVVTTLLKGHSSQVAHNRSRKAMYKNFRKMISSSATDEEKAYARFLWSNLKSQVLYSVQSKKD